MSPSIDTANYALLSNNMLKLDFSVDADFRVYKKCNLKKIPFALLKLK